MERVLSRRRAGSAMGDKERWQTVSEATQWLNGDDLQSRICYEWVSYQSPWSAANPSQPWAMSLRMPMERYLHVLTGFELLWVWENDPKLWRWDSKHTHVSTCKGYFSKVSLNSPWNHPFFTSLVFTMWHIMFGWIWTHEKGYVESLWNHSGRSKADCVLIRSHLQSGFFRDGWQTIDPFSHSIRYSCSDFWFRCSHSILCVSRALWHEINWLALFALSVEGRWSQARVDWNCLKTNTSLAHGVLDRHYANSYYWHSPIGVDC